MMLREPAGPDLRAKRETTAARRGILLVVICLAAAAGCGYSVSARPPLTGGVTRVTIPVIENDTAETEVGVLMAAALARRAEADGRLAGRNESSARLIGRIEALRASPVAFPQATPGAGMYALTLQLRLRLMPEGGGGAISELSLTGREEYLAGASPEETEAHRRLALERLCERLADDAWGRLTAP